MNLLSDADKDDIRKQFKRCSEPTIEAIIRYRQEPNATDVELILRGIMERYLKGEARTKFDAATNDTELTNLGIESLTMLEIVLDAQDALWVEIGDEELRTVKTLGDVQTLLASKISQVKPA